MKRFLKIFVICFVCWLILLFITSKGDVQSDNIGEVGFPFVFHREFYGKGDYSKLDLGINYKNLIIDLTLVLLISLGVTKIFSLRKAK